MFQPVPSSVHFPDQENEIIRFWKKQRIFEKSLENRIGAKPFVFNEGPPTANGMPHPGHCLTRAIKDLFPRYRTMRGEYCERKAGWDTHGLPVEVEVCKELGIHSKKEIEAYGVEAFIHRCQENVWRYMQQWQRNTERIGYWLDLENAYVTYHRSFIDSEWWALANLYERGLLYQEHKIVWWWAQGGTALSSSEVGQGYREVADPSVFVRCPLLDEPEVSLLFWTTTPWSIPSNQFIAVRAEAPYAQVLDTETGQRLILAAELVPTLAEKVKRELTVEKTFLGSELLGRRYLPPFDFFFRTQKDILGTLVEGGQEHVGWRVVAADFVEMNSGSGLVPQAPAFGEVDFNLLQGERRRFVSGEGPELLCPVSPEGRFTSLAPDYEGLWVKEADKSIIRDLKTKGLLYHQEQYLHDYPFCWRAEQDPLIQYPRRSWFIRTTQFKDKMLANNEEIRWLPDHIKHGRFGNFLETNVDWALSRERYWGTPLPIWVCEETGKKEAIHSFDELLAKPGRTGTEMWEEAKAANPALVDDLQIHVPYIDAITYDSPFAPGARMRRVPEVIDCWFDSGSMPFAQFGYPYLDPEKKALNRLPADFISEALDQCRGFFYSQLAISTLLFGDPTSSTEDRPLTSWPHPFRNCIVLGFMLGEDGQKMSKSKRNYREPDEIFDRYGADALRWYFFANQPPWTTIRYSEQAIKDSIPEFLLRLWNVYSFFLIYARIDGFDPTAELAGNVGQLPRDVLAQAKTFRPVHERGELDRWILGELAAVSADVTKYMDGYENYPACQRIIELVDALSNWYVRRSRDRFWSADKQCPDKLDAYWTLYECLLTTSKLIAPFVPFLAETLWQNLANVPFAGRAVESPHLCDFPTGAGQEVDRELSQRMSLVREIASLGRSARMDAKLKVRQPLAKVEVVLATAEHCQWLEAHAALVREELNVKQVEFTTHGEQYITYTVLPDFKRLGPRLGKQLPAVKQALVTADGAALLADLKRSGSITLTLPDGEAVKLDADDIQVRLQAKPGWAAAEGPQCVVVLSTELSSELVEEGLARELVRVVQDRRKELELEYTTRIQIGVVTESPELRSAATRFASYIQQETLAVSLVFEPLPGTTPAELSIAENPASIHVQQVL